MGFDFSRINLNAQRYHWSYRCDWCGAVETFAVEMPSHMRNHHPLGGRCGGYLKFQSKSPQPKKS